MADDDRSCGCLLFVLVILGFMICVYFLRDAEAAQVIGEALKMIEQSNG